MGLGRRTANAGPVLNQNTNMPTNEAQTLTKTPAAPRMVRLYNRSAGTLSHPPYRLGPGFGNIPAEIAALWLKDFPDKVVAAADAESSGESTAKERDSFKIQLEAANRRITDLEEQLKRATSAVSLPPRPEPLLRAPTPIRVLSKPSAPRPATPGK